MCAAALAAMPLTVGRAADGEAVRLPEFTAVYSISKGTFTIAETTRTLSNHGNGRYLFSSTTRPAALGRLLSNGEIIERSEWTFHQNTIRPLQYSYADSSKKNQREVQLTFDWDGNDVTNTINGDPWKMQLAPGTQDKLVYQLRLMLDLPTRRQALLYPVADGGQLKEYRLDIVGNERVKTKLGEFDAVQVRRASGDRVTTFWCAKELNYLPVRIEQRAGDGSPVVASLISVQGLR